MRKPPRLRIGFDGYPSIKEIRGFGWCGFGGGFRIAFARDKCRAACQSAPQALNAAMAADGATAAVSQHPDTPWLGRLATTLLRCGSACRHHAPRTQLALVRGSTGNINAFVAAVSNIRDFGALGRPETGGGGRVGFGLEVA